MNKQKNRKIKRISLLVLVCFASLALILVFLEATNITNIIKSKTKHTPVNNPTTPFDSSTPEQKKQDSAINAANKQQSIKQENGQTTQTTSNTSQTIDISARQETNSSVTVFTKLYGFSSGSCNLTVTNNSAVNNQVAKIIYAPEYSSCAGFSVPITDIGTGNWLISLKVDYNGLTAYKNISFKVM